MHADQLDVDAELVRRLVARVFPEWAALAVVPVPHRGTVNAMFRLGDGLAVRVPLRGDAVAAHAELDREAAAEQELRGLPVPVPRRVALAGPSDDLPVPWVVQTWLPGTTADGSGPAGFADDLCAVIEAIRAVPLHGRRFSGTARGGRLTDHDGWVDECLARSGGLVDVGAARTLWNRLRAVPRSGTDVMAHGDLIPPNLLVDSDGRLAGLLDLGLAGPADPALDLLGAWHCLEAGPRTQVRVRLGSDDAEWARGQAWALEQSLGLGWYYARSNPGMSALGVRTVKRILAEPAIP